MPEFNPYAAPPTSESDLKAPLIKDEQGLWRHGELLVARKGAQLPDRCTRCNLPSEGPKIRHRLAWHHPGWSILIISPLIYLIALSVVRKTANVEVGLCPEHRSKRKRVMRWGTAMVLIGLCLFVAGFVVTSDRPVVSLLIGGGALALIAWACTAHMMQAVTPQRIDKHFVWLKGVAPSFIADLPPWPL